jgi:hypothetical protein
MSDDNQRQEATTGSDMSRHIATSNDSEYVLSIEDTLALYQAAGLPRTTRSIQRYCAKGDLDAHRIETPFGEKFLVTPASVDRHIAYINEVRLAATGRDMSRHVATDDQPQNHGTEPRVEAAASNDNQRHAPTTSDMSPPVAQEPEPLSRHVAASDDKYVALLERENDFLRDQVAVKDGQIKELGERVRETNVLTAGLQKLLTPLLGAPDRVRDHGPQNLGDDMRS